MTNPYGCRLTKSVVLEVLQVYFRIKLKTHSSFKRLPILLSLKEHLFRSCKCLKLSNNLVAKVHYYFKPFLLHFLEVMELFKIHSGRWPVGTFSGKKIGPATREKVQNKSVNRERSPGSSLAPIRYCLLHLCTSKLPVLLKLLQRIDGPRRLR
jgi:hypothetical protein